MLSTIKVTTSRLSDCPTPRELLRKLARRGVSPTYIHEILAAFGSGEAAPVSTLSGAALLTGRELEVLELLDKRYSDKEIAASLHMGYDTVRTHISHIFEKLHVRSRAGAVVRYLTGSGPRLARPPEKSLVSGIPKGAG